MTAVDPHKDHARALPCFDHFFGHQLCNGKCPGDIDVEQSAEWINWKALGHFVAALLCLPHKVQRSDQSRVLIDIPKGLKDELRSMWKLLCRKEILLLLPMMFQSVFSEAFLSTHNATYLTVRARALASLVASVCVIVSNFTLGFVLDWRKSTPNTHAVGVFVVIYAFEMMLYIYAMIISKEYEGRNTKLPSGYGPTLLSRTAPLSLT
ncbi:hypothetical protein AK830_g1345 [Neonectria ditissima]|uniref:Uncharacterized protein n=1 Tax=Neonectria ditissima TaxID=78410 RepID=A0A0P7BF67_9HYPO|nr:hypothetical protein AK830_g1345 [Neonectria ditissima]